MDFARLQDSKIQGIPQMWTLLCVHLLVASLTSPRAFEISICSVFLEALFLTSRCLDGNLGALNTGLVTLVSMHWYPTISQ